MCEAQVISNKLASVLRCCFA